MDRRVAFLRAVNVGGHTIKMADLRVAFEGLGLQQVETFIASGNVVFDAAEADEATLVRRIERELESRFGYPIETFIRSMDELAALVGADPFHRGKDDGEHNMFIAFLERRPTETAIDRLVGLATPDDAFALLGREAYWLRRGGIGTSRFSAGFLEKTLGMPATLRGRPTIVKLLAKFA